MTVTFATESGRILQVSVCGRGAFWVADDPVSWNLGGDRLWLGPERNWFWAGTDRDDLGNHVVPAEIDPGNWDVVHRRPDGVDLVLTATLLDRTTRAATGVVVERHVTVLADTRYVAEYETETVLHVPGHAAPGIENRQDRLAPGPDLGQRVLQQETTCRDTARRCGAWPRCAPPEAKCRFPL